MSLPLRWQDPEPNTLLTVTPAPRSRKSRNANLRRLRLLVGACTVSVLCGLAVVGAASVVTALRPAPGLRLVPAQSSQSKASLASASIERRLGFVSVSGSVLSHNHQPLAKVEAVVELLDAQNHTVQVESGMVAFDPLPPDEAAPFHIEVTDVPQAVAYRVRFRQLDGLCLN